MKKKGKKVIFFKKNGDKEVGLGVKRTSHPTKAVQV